MPNRITVLLLAALAVAPLSPPSIAGDVAPGVRAAFASGRASAPVIVRTVEGRAPGRVLAALAGDPASRTLPALGMVAATISERELDALAGDPAVRAISIDVEVRALARLTAKTRLARPARTARGAPTGEGVGIALIDTGLDRSRVDGPVRAVGLLRGERGEEGADLHGHGTFLAGLMREAAPRAHIVSLRVLDAEGRGRASDVLAAVDWLIAHRAEHGVRVATFALATAERGRCRRDPLSEAMHRLRDAGILPVAAAGRARGGGIASPACSPHALGVGGTVDMGTARRGDDRVADDSPRGEARGVARPKPDLVAPLDVSGYRGTSIAAATVSASAALVADAAPTLGPDELAAVLLFTAQTLDGADALGQGAGQLNADGAVTLARALERALLAGRSSIDAAQMPPPYTDLGGELIAWSAGHLVVPGSMFVTRYRPADGELAGEIGREAAAVLAGGAIEAGRVRLGRGARLDRPANADAKIRYTFEDGRPVRIARTRPNAAGRETPSAASAVRRAAEVSPATSIAGRDAADPYSGQAGKSASSARTGEK